MKWLTDWTVTLPVWAIAVLAFFALIVMFLTVAMAMSSGAADRTAESMRRQQALRDEAARNHAERNRN